jgi:hypothetical protein
MRHKVISCSIDTHCDLIIEELFVACNSDWDEMARTYFYEFCDITQLLDDDLSNSFKSFVKDTAKLTDFQRGCFRNSYQNRNVTTRDVSFLFLELEFPFRPHPLNQVVSKNSVVKEASLDVVVDKVAYYMKYNGNTTFSRRELAYIRQVLEHNFVSNDENKVIIEKIKNGVIV